MKAALVLILFATFACAQDQTAISAAIAACGPTEVKFDAKQDATQHPVPQPNPDKASVYVIQDLGQEECAGCAVTRVALDGKWVGANHGTSYFFFDAEPGERHICVNWQSRLESRSRVYGLADFTAEAGHAYYFRVRLLVSRSIYSFDLDPINSDQGKFLVASSPFSVSQAKK